MRAFRGLSIFVRTGLADSFSVIQRAAVPCVIALAMGAFSEGALAEPGDLLVTLDNPAPAVDAPFTSEPGQSAGPKTFSYLLVPNSKGHLAGLII